MKQTAVEWLVEEANLLENNGWILPLIEQAKEMEKQQQDDFAIEFTEWKDKFISEIDDWKQDGVYLKNNYSIKELLEQFKNK